MCNCHPAGDGCIRCNPWNQGHNYNDGARLGDFDLEPGNFLVKKRKGEKGNVVSEKELYLWLAVTEDEAEHQDWYGVAFWIEGEITLCKN
jgi:hypothetical protein